MQKWIILIVVCIIIIGTIFIVKNVTIETEYTPETEIEETDLRTTIVSLFFTDKTTHQIVKETQLVDSKILLREPYKEIVNLLMNGPQNSNYERVIPDGLELVDCVCDNGCVTVKFLKQNSNVEIEQSIIDKVNETVSRTLNELKEVYEVKIEIEIENPQ